MPIPGDEGFEVGFETHGKKGHSDSETNGARGLWQ